MNYPNLNLMLHAANRRALATSLTRTLFMGGVTLGLGVLLAVALDAIFAFPVWALLAVDALLVWVVLKMTFRTIGVMRSHRFDPRRIARQLEGQLGMTNNALINSIDLREDRHRHASRALLEASIERGELTAQDVCIESAIASKPARRALLAAFGTAVLLAATYWLQPALFGRGLPRLFDPTGGHPPFTLVKFDVQVNPQPLYHGGTATVSVALGGPQIPDHADLVFDGAADDAEGADAEGEQQQRRLPFIPVDDVHAIVLESVTKSRRFYIDTPLGRSDWLSLDVLQVPLINDAWVEYHYPDYTDWPSQRQRLRGDEIRAIKGTQVTLEVSSNLPLGECEFELLELATRVETQAGDDQTQRDTKVVGRILMKPVADEPRLLRGQFTLNQSGQCRIALKGHNGAPGPEQRDISLVAVDDQSPAVAIVDPEPTVYAVEGWKLPVVADADDDVELSGRPELNYVLNEGKSESVEMSPPDSDAPLDSRRRRRGEFELDLEQLGAKPGDEIRMFASAADNHPDPQQSSDSSTHVVRIISMEQYQDYLRELYDLNELQQEINDLQQSLESLAESRDAQTEQLESLQQVLAEQQAAGEPPDEASQQQLNDAQRTAADFQRQLDELRHQMEERLEMPQLYQNEDAYREKLQQLADKLEDESKASEAVQESLESIRQSAKETQSPTSEQMQQFSESLERMQQAGTAGDALDQESLQQQESLTRQLNMAHDMLSQSARIQQVMEQQRELADRMKPLEQEAELTPEQQARADRLARDQELLNQELEEAVTQLHEAAARAQEELPRTASDAEKLCNAIGQQQISDDQQQAAKSARQGEGQQAEQSADRAADKLEALAGSCPNAGGASGEIDPGLGLSRQSAQQMLEQMSRKPSLSSLGSTGQNPGNAPGQGTQGGDAIGQQATRRANGPRSEFGLRGPRPPIDSFGQRRRGASHRDNGLGAGDDPRHDTLMSPESIRADAHSADRQTAGRLQSVPVGYRDQAEAYFRRLAEQP